MNATYYGYADNSADEYDWYGITMPMFHSINASLSWNTSSVDLDLHLFDENGSYIDYSYYDNPENVTSGNSAIGGTNVTLLVRAWSGGDNYTLTLTFDNISSSPIYNQNDAGTGDDASDEVESDKRLKRIVSPRLASGPGRVRPLPGSAGVRFLRVEPLLARALAYRFPQENV